MRGNAKSAGRARFALNRVRASSSSRPRRNRRAPARRRPCPVACGRSTPARASENTFGTSSRRGGGGRMSAARLR